MIYINNNGQESHYVSTLHYHFVPCVKFGRNFLCSQPRVDLLKTKIHDISKTFDVDVLNVECDQDHFHMIFTAKPTLDIPKYINAIKTISSREIRRNFPEIKTMLWEGTFWSRSYFIATTGQVTSDILKKYVDSQCFKNDRDGKEEEIQPNLE
jgi:putative transposase